METFWQVRLFFICSLTVKGVTRGPKGLSRNPRQTSFAGKMHCMKTGGPLENLCFVAIKFWLRGSVKLYPRTLRALGAEAIRLRPGELPLRRCCLLCTLLKAALKRRQSSVWTSRNRVYNISDAVAAS